LTRSPFWINFHLLHLLLLLWLVDLLHGRWHDFSGCTDLTGGSDRSDWSGLVTLIITARSQSVLDRPGDSIESWFPSWWMKGLLV
jgi:hypothetical protein